MTPRLRSVALSAVCGLFAAACPSAAHAYGAVVANPPGSLQITELRSALASADGHQTKWAQLRAKSNAISFAWILPIGPGAVLDAGTSSFLDALEDATATRVQPPPAPPAGAVCQLPTQAETTTNGDAAAYLYPDTVTLSPTEDDVVKLLAEWGYPDPEALALPAPPESTFVVLRFTPPKTAFATLTVRLWTAEGGAQLDQRMMEAAPTRALLGTTFLLGPGVGSLEVGAVVKDIPATSVVWRSSSGTTYRETRDALLAPERAAFVRESADATVLSTSKRLAGGVELPSLVAAYLDRVKKRGESAVDRDEAEASILGAIAQSGSRPAPCPRGDLAGKPPCAKSAHPFAVDDLSDDLAFAVGSPTVVTRLAGIIGANRQGEQRAVSFDASALPLPVVREPTVQYPLLCSSLPSTGGPSGTGGTGGKRGGGGGRPGQEGADGAVADDAVDNAGDSSQTSVGIFCDGSSRSTAEDDACSSRDATTDDSCSSKDDGTQTDSCGASDEAEGDSCSNSEEGGDSCSGSEGGGDSCSNADGSAPSGCDSGGAAAGDACGECAATRGRASKRVRLSPLGLGAAACALFLRRKTRRSR